MAVLWGAQQIEKTYGSRTLFRNISFSIESKQRIGLIGPNGAGKSSLLKIISQLEQPDGGKVTQARGLRIGYLSQSPALDDSMTVIETLLTASPDPDDYQTLSQAEEYISHLSLDSEKIGRDSKIKELSGGWRKKVALAKEMMKNPDLLLLDEPTNHLDLESILWLEEFLANQTQMAVLTVTHDRLFLQNVADFIFDLDVKYKDGLLKIQGGYAEYLEARENIAAGLRAQESARKNDLRRELSWLRRGAQARQTKQKARIESAFDLMDEVADLKSKNRVHRIDLELSGPGRSPKKLVEADKIGKSFGDRVLFQDLDLLLSPQSRIGLLGRNGAGKTTLIRTLLGEIKPDSGKIKFADGLKVSYFAQHRESLDPNLTLLKSLCPEGDYVHLNDKPLFAKSYLDRFKFRPEQHDMPVGKLSGGEQSRLLIAKMMLQSAHVLVLDEPTNDLDIETLDVLRESLNSYDGAIILVTHDRYFMDEVCETILAFVDPSEKLPSEKAGLLVKFAGYLQWQDWRSKRKVELENLQQKQKREQSFNSSSSSQKTPKSKQRKLGFKEQKELEGMEGVILKKEAHLNDLQSKMSSPETLSNSNLLLQLSTEIAALESEIEGLYQRWSELSS